MRANKEIIAKVDYIAQYRRDKQERGGESCAAQTHCCILEKEVEPIQLDSSDASY